MYFKLKDYSTVEQFCDSNEDWMNEDENDFNGMKLTKRFKDIIPKTYVCVDSEMCSQNQLDFVLNFFNLKTRDIPMLPAITEYHGSIYRAFAEGEMTWGIWVSPLFLIDFKHIFTPEEA